MVYVHYYALETLGESIGFSGARCELPCGCCGPDLGPLQEQSAFLMTEQSLQPLVWFLSQGLAMQPSSRPPRRWTYRHESLDLTQIPFIKTSNHDLGLVVKAYNPSTWEVLVGGLGVLLHIKFPGNKRPWLKTKKKFDK